MATDDQFSPHPSPQGSGAKTTSSVIQGWVDSAKDQMEAADTLTRRKAAVVGVWAVVSLICVLIAFLPYLTTNVKSMDAKLDVNEISTVKSSIIAFKVDNTGAENWVDKVTLTLNGRYRLLAASVETGKYTVAQMDKFLDDNDDSPPPEEKPVTLRVDTSAGSITFDVATREIIGR